MGKFENNFIFLSKAKKKRKKDQSKKLGCQKSLSRAWLNKHRNELG